MVLFFYRLDLGRKNPCGTKRLLLACYKIFWRNSVTGWFFVFLCFYGGLDHYKTLLPLASVIPVFPLSESAFRLKKIFSFCAGYFYSALLSGGENRFCISPVKFSFFARLLFLCVFRFDFATSVSGLLIPVQNDHLNFQIGFCLFCFFGFILLGLGWGGWLAGRTHSFSFKFSWDRTSSWDSHPYHTWRWKDCLCLSFWQEPVPDCLQLTSYLGGCSLWIFVYNRFPWAINLWSLFHAFAYDFRPVLLELFGSTIGPYLLDVF